MLRQDFSNENLLVIFHEERRRGAPIVSNFCPEIRVLEKKMKKCKRILRKLIILHHHYKKEIILQRMKFIRNRYTVLKQEKRNCIVKILNPISEKINNKSWEMNTHHKIDGNGKNIFTLDKNLFCHIVLRKVINNIRKVYNIKPSDRQIIMLQIKSILSTSFPFYIIRTDIENFYESINASSLLCRLRNDGLLSATTLQVIDHVLKKCSQKEKGLPRGIGFSSYLSELFMRDFDSKMRSMQDVVYYARYVDDIFVVYAPPQNRDKSIYVNSIDEYLDKIELKRNKNKTEIFLNKNKKCFTYLGYEIIIKKDGIEFDISNNKFNRYKNRLDAIFKAYKEQYSSNNSRALRELFLRIKYLTGNTRLPGIYNKVFVGLFFSNPLLNLSNNNKLKELDKYMIDSIRKIPQLKKNYENYLARYSFVTGFEEKKYYKFTVKEIKRIISPWSHV